MARIRPTELNAIIELLDQPHDSVDALARQVITTLDELRAKRQTWFVVQLLAGKLPILWGPYATSDAARKDIGRTITGTQAGEQGWIVPLKAGVDD